MISLTTKGLNQITSSTDWTWLGAWLAKELLNAEKLENIAINRNEFILKCSLLKEKDLLLYTGIYELEAASGTICFKDKNQSKKALLPMDPSIQIKKIILKEGEMVIAGLAEVTP